MSKHSPSILSRVVEGALAILVVAVVLTLALQLLSALWGWLLLFALVGLVAIGLVQWRRSRDRRW
ncbi:hypothetical protein [Pseudolysinimonas sp.]|jgi:hypothetical protein|uniref:hypothetical protein n=1 Tax=Pseudolysinimonas sp. TaxID=2680009 RepID=UPI003783B273